MKQIPRSPVQCWFKMVASWNLGTTLKGGAGVRGESLANETYPDSFSEFVSFVLSGIV